MPTCVLFPSTSVFWSCPSVLCEDCSFSRILLHRYSRLVSSLPQILLSWLFHGVTDFCFILYCRRISLLINRLLIMHARIGCLAVPCLSARFAVLFFLSYFSSLLLSSRLFASFASFMSFLLFSSLLLYCSLELFFLQPILRFRIENSIDFNSSRQQ